VVRGLAQLAPSEPAAAELYRLFTFDELWSFGYAFNVLGYAVWAWPPSLLQQAYGWLRVGWHGPPRFYSG
jgi:hypothetical protein